MDKQERWRAWGSFVFLVILVGLLFADAPEVNTPDNSTCRKQQGFTITYRYTTNCAGASTSATGQFTLRLEESGEVGMTESVARSLGAQAREGGFFSTRWFLRWFNVCRARVPQVPDASTQESDPPEGDAPDAGIADAGTTDAGEQPPPTPGIPTDNGIPFAFLSTARVPSKAAFERIQFLYLDDPNPANEAIKEISCPATMPIYKSDVVDGTMMWSDVTLSCDIYTTPPKQECPKEQPNCDGSRPPNGRCQVVLQAITGSSE